MNNIDNTSEYTPLKIGYPTIGEHFWRLKCLEYLREKQEQIRA